MPLLQQASSVVKVLPCILPAADSGGVCSRACQVHAAKPGVVCTGDLLRDGPSSVQAGLVYRAIDMNMRLHQWKRALQLATHHKVHQDTVLLRRQQFLAGMQQPETDSHFLQLAAECTVDPLQVEARVQQELQKEAERPGAVRYT